MIDGLTSDHWASLRARRPRHEDAYALIPIVVDGLATRLSMAMDQAGDLHMLIAVDSGPTDAQPPDLCGLKVRHRRLTTGDVLDLSAPSSHEKVFTPFCREVAKAVVGEKREPWAAVATTIREWQSAWRSAHQAMDKSTQIGLFGELFVLRSLMIPAMGPNAIQFWSGPESERHDFVLESLHIEVKTTRKSRPEHEISRVDQLQAPPGCTLLLISIQLEESIGGDETLATQVDAVVDLLRQDSASLDQFMHKMAVMKWSEELRNSDQLLRFFVQRAELYLVDDDFPRLPADFVLPSGIVSLKYTVDLANLPSMGAAEARELIAQSAANHSP